MFVARGREGGREGGVNFVSGEDFFPLFSTRVSELEVHKSTVYTRTDVAALP